MGLFEAIIYGIIQGVAEFLPVSSSGHLALAHNFFGTADEEGVAFGFDILLHFGTLVAVLIVYRKDVLLLIKGFFSLVGKLFSGKLKDGLDYGEKLFVMLALSSVLLIPVALVSDHVEALSGVSWAVGLLLMVNGAMLFVSDRLNRASLTLENAPVKKALFIGLFQLFGVLPGISRSGSTITGGLFNNLERKDAIKFSFLMSIPTILGANLLSLLKYEGNFFADVSLVPCLAGVFTALVTGIGAIKLLQYLAKNKSFGIFSVYCIAVGAVAIVLDVFFL